MYLGWRSSLPVQGLALRFVSRVRRAAGHLARAAGLAREARAAVLSRGHRADRIRHRPAGKRRTVGWVGFINPATKETDNRTPERWVDGANPAYVDFLSADRVAKLAVRYRPVLEDGEAIVRIAMLCEAMAEIGRAHV